MKRRVLFLPAVMAAFLVAACAAFTSEPAVTTPPPTVTPAPTATPAPEPKTVKVGVCIYKFDDNFMTMYRNGLERYINSLSDNEYTYEVTIVDGKNDQTTQTEQINTFVAEKYDVLIINLVQSTAAASVINVVKAAGIPAVFINREPTDEDMNLWDRICYVGADAHQSGTYMGEIINELPDKGNLNGDGTISYVMLLGDPECSGSGSYRTEFAIKAITDSGMKVEKLAEERGDWDRARGQEVTANALARFGDKIEVVIANNDAMGLGALDAIREAGRTVNKDIYLVSVDALDEVVELVEKGEYTGTVKNDTEGQARTAADAAVKYVKGEAVQKYYIVDYLKIVKQ